MRVLETILAVALLFQVPGALMSSDTSEKPEDPLSYRTDAPSYVAPKPEGVTTLLDFIKSKPELSELSNTLREVGGFEAAFETPPTWNFTFFAPNNAAFNNAGQYFDTFAKTP